MSSILTLVLMPVLIIFVVVFGRTIRTITILSAASCWLHLVVTACLLSPVFDSSKTVLYIDPAFKVDRLAASFILLTMLVMASALTHAYFFFAQEERKSHNALESAHVRQFYLLCALFLAAMTAVYLCNNLGYLWMSVEATTLCSAGMVYFARTKHALEATWKYFIICSVGIAFALLGTVLIFASSQFATP